MVDFKLLKICSFTISQTHCVMLSLSVGTFRLVSQPGFSTKLQQISESSLGFLSWRLTLDLLHNTALLWFMYVNKFDLKMHSYLVIDVNLYFPFVKHVINVDRSSRFYIGFVLCRVMVGEGVGGREGGCDHLTPNINRVLIIKS